MNNQYQLEVISLDEVAMGLFRLVFQSPKLANESKPGQFLMVDCNLGTASSGNLFLRRPLAVHRTNIKEGEMVAIMGPSGCGKTTLLNCLSGLDSINSGSIKLQNMELESLSDDKLSEFRAKNMGFVFQSYNLLPVLTTVENVELPLLVSGMSSKQARMKSESKLNDVGLLDWKQHLPGELSGGQRQRVATARAIVNNPSIILADEPTGNLDSETSIEIMKLFQKIHQKGNTIIVVTHEEDIAKYAGRIIRLKDGIIESDTLNI